MKKIKIFSLIVVLLITLLSACDYLPDNLQDQVSPVLTKAEIRDGDASTLYLVFSKEMSANIPASPAGFAVVRNANSMTIASITKTSDITTYALTMTENFVQGDIVTVSYTGTPVVTSSGGGILGAFSGISVTNMLGTITPNLVFWNKLGSESEVLNSEVGPDLVYYTGGSGFEVAGDRSYVTGKYGNGVTVAGTYSIGDRVHNLVLNNPSQVIDPERGTIEVWYLQNETPVEYSHSPHRIFDGSFGLGSGIGLQSYAIGSTTNNLQFSINLGGTASYAIYTNISSHNGNWVHIAAVWDRNGINGSSETIRIYINGTSVASSIGSAWGTTVGSMVDICGGNDNNIANKFAIDNLKIWDAAKTSFDLVNE